MRSNSPTRFPHSGTGPRKRLFSEVIETSEGGTLTDRAMQGFELFVVKEDVIVPDRMTRDQVRSQVEAAATEYLEGRMFSERPVVDVVTNYRQGLAAANALSAALAKPGAGHITRGLEPALVDAFRRVLRELEERSKCEPSEHTIDGLLGLMRPKMPHKGRPKKDYLDGPVRILADLWQRLTGTPVSGYVDQDELGEFVGKGARFVHHLLLAMDSSIDAEAVRTPLVRLTSRKKAGGNGATK